MGILLEIFNFIVFLNVCFFKFKINCYWKYYWNNLSFLWILFVDCILLKILFKLFICNCKFWYFWVFKDKSVNMYIVGRLVGKNFGSYDFLLNKCVFC